MYFYLTKKEIWFRLKYDKTILEQNDQRSFFWPKAFGFKCSKKLIRNESLLVYSIPTVATFVKRI